MSRGSMVSRSVLDHFCLQMTDIDAEHARLKAAGMVFHCLPQARSGLRVTYGRDPDGNVIELLEVTDRESMPVVQAG